MHRRPVAERNSTTFQRANAKRSARMLAIVTLTAAITEKEADLARLQRELGIRRVEKESTPSALDSIGIAPAAPIPDPVAEPVIEQVPESAPEPIAVVTVQPEPVVDTVSVKTSEIAPDEIVMPEVIETPESNTPVPEEKVSPPVADLVPAAPIVVAVDPVVEAEALSTLVHVVQGVAAEPAEVSEPIPVEYLSPSISESSPEMTEGELFRQPLDVE
ncbi:hypothetical protein [Collimonas humicola]|uniref:hypothetical protein n=1 Tax=Collimonas humicola TaxID=2825886 RepID=UPI001B8C2150|nr:hypothetical protein [Collimonas humicola]